MYLLLSIGSTGAWAWHRSVVGGTGYGDSIQYGIKLYHASCVQQAVFVWLSYV